MTWTVCYCCFCCWCFFYSLVHRFSSYSFACHPFRDCKTSTRTFTALFKSVQISWPLHSNLELAGWLAGWLAGYFAPQWCANSANLAKLLNSTTHYKHLTKSPAKLFLLITDFLCRRDLRIKHQVALTISPFGSSLLHFISNSSKLQASKRWFDFTSKLSNNRSKSKRMLLESQSSPRDSSIILMANSNGIDR